MYFAQRTIKRIKIAISVGAFYLVIVALLAQYFPAPGISFAQAYLRWLAVIPATIAAWLCGEWLVTKALELKFWSRLPSWARIALLVAVVVLIAVLALCLQGWWEVHGAA